MLKTTARLLIAALLIACRTADAATFNVAAGDVPGLVAAITSANADGAADTIELAGGSFDLTAPDNTSVADGPNGLPVITSPVVINGHGATIRRTGTPPFRIFQIGSGGALTLNEVTVSGGSAPGANGAGGGIALTGTNDALTLTDCTVTSNAATVFGGGIAVRGASEAVTLTRTTVSDNTAIAGGGIQVQAQNVTLTLDRCRLTGNGAASPDQTTDGGGMSVSGGPHTITLTDCVLDDNTASTGGSNSAQGGGISSSAEVNWTITRTTISGNRAASATGVGAGGGIVDNGAAVWTLTNCTISGNTVTGPIAFLGGGGIDSDSSATFTLNNVTVTGNQARAGGGIEVAAGTVTLSNSIVAGNGGNANSPDISGPVTSHGHNLFGTIAGAAVTLGTGDLVNPSAGLGPLADNGGPTPTHALLAGSPAIDAANPGTPGSGGDACAATDQRGTARPLGGGCDIGAFEAAPGMETLVDSYFLPRSVKMRIFGPGKDVFAGSGFYDDGGRAVDYAQDVTIDIGGYRKVFRLVRNSKGTAYKFRDANITVSVAPNLKGSSRGKFKMRIEKESLAGKVDPDAAVDFHFSAAGLPDAAGRVILTAGRYRLGKVRGALLLPPFFPQALTAKVGGANLDSFGFRGGFATHGQVPPAVGVPRFAIGPLFSVSAAGGTLKNGIYRFKSAKGATPKVSLAIDFTREVVTVKASKAELGNLDAPTIDVVFDDGIGGGTIRSTVRLGTAGAKRTY